FSTLGWPDESASDYQKFYPTTVMETGYDILFFWVARMIMMGLELTGKIPFETVYLHGLVRDEQNRKMSKSLGNVLDPLDLIAKYGTDALRMALIVGSTPGQDLAVGESKIKGYRNFTNKIWNASRFVSLRVTEGDLQSGELGDARITDLDIDEKLLTSADKKILNQHEEIKKSVTAHIDKFQFSLAGEELYKYFWHEFCDQYIEEAKKQLEDKENKKAIENTKKILIKILSESLVIMHPYLPFITEAVWQELREFTPDLAESIMISNWPKQITLEITNV
ncbi:valine--tRNA ligase, partial [Candidatus Berkelbacteria bacterium CG08_land_8_20_14_0_20_39_8]